MKRINHGTVRDLLLDEAWSLQDARSFQEFLESCFPGKETQIRIALANDESGLRVDLKKAFCTDSIELELQHAVLKRVVFIINYNLATALEENVIAAPAPFEEPPWLSDADLLAATHQHACVCFVR